MITKENLIIWKQGIQLTTGQLICFTKRNVSSYSGLSTGDFKATI